MRQEIDASEDRGLFARMVASGHGYVTFATRHPAYFRTIFGQPIWREGGVGWESLRAAGEEAYGVLRGLVVEGVESGALRPGNPDQIALAAWSLIHGFSMLVIEGRLEPMGIGPASLRGVTEMLMRSLERGLAP